MEFIKKILVAVAIFAACAVHTDSFARVKKAGLANQAQQVVAPVAEPIEDVEIVVNTEREKIEQAVIDTEKIKTAATLAINDANEQLAQGKISHIQAAQIIGEQQYVIDQAKLQLAQLAGKSIEKVQDASYLAQLLSGAQAAKAGLLEGIGYSSTAQQKAIAQAVIDELKKQLDSVNVDYAKKIEAASNAQDKAKLFQELDTIKRDIEKEIYRQQTITEEVTSTNKKLFWSAVGLAGAAVGAALAYQYLGTQAPGATIEGITTEKEIFPTSPVITTTAPQPAITTQISEPQTQIPGAPSAPGVIPSGPSTSQEQSEISQLPAVNPDVSETGEPIVGPTGNTNEQTEASSTAQKMIKTAQDAALKTYGLIKGSAANAYENIGKALGGRETEEEYLERTSKAKEAIQSPTLFPVQPPVKLSPAEQEARIAPEKEILGGSFGHLVTDEDLSGVSINPKEYQEPVGAAGTAIANVLGGVAEEQNRQEEQIPSGLGTGGLTPSEYEERVAEGLKSTAETAAKILEKSAIEREKQEEEQIPSGLGTGGLTPSEYRELVDKRLESQKENAIKSLRSTTQRELKDMLLPEDYGNYRYERNRDLARAQIEEIKELEKDWRLIQKQAELNNDTEKLQFVNSLMGTIAGKLEREPGTTAQQYFDDTVKLREQFLKDVENFDATRPQAPKTQKQIEEGSKNKEAAQKTIKEAQERKRQTKDEGTQK